MIRILYWHRGEMRATDLALDRLPSALRDEEGLLWLDLAAEEPAALEPLLRDTMRFHPLAIEDALQERHVAKIDDWGDYVYLVVHGLDYDPEGGDGAVHHVELDIFVGPNYIVTHHEEEVPVLRQVWDGLSEGRLPSSFSPARVLHLILDDLVASHVPLVERLDDAIDEVEESIFRSPRPETLERILSLKRGVQQLRRAIGPQREVYNRLARDPYPVIGEEDRVYFRDTYDQAVRLLDIIESIRDLTTSVLDTHLSATSNRLNDIMKTLTIITTLFMPLSFVASFMGMNFFGPSTPLPAWTSVPALAVTLVIMALTPLSMYLWMRGRRWM